MFRHLEAPDRFRAIQTYRAAMALMSQQRQFILRLYNSGMLTEAERELVEDVRPPPLPGLTLTFWALGMRFILWPAYTVRLSQGTTG